MGNKCTMQLATYDDNCKHRSSRTFSWKPNETKAETRFALKIRHVNDKWGKTGTVKKAALP